jgi:uncharacterized protein YqfB (UPF0267 family)
MAKEQKGIGRIIAFAHTTPALLAGRKTVTRRAWNDDYAGKFRAGDLVQAYNRSPRFGGQRVAYIRLTADPYWERLADMPEADLAAEGGLWATREEFIAAMGGPEQTVWVIRFEVVHIEPKDAEEPQEEPRQVSFAFPVEPTTAELRASGAYKLDHGEGRAILDHGKPFRR